MTYFGEYGSANTERDILIHAGKVRFSYNAVPLPENIPEGMNVSMLVPQNPKMLLEDKCTIVFDLDYYLQPILKVRSPELYPTIAYLKEVKIAEVSLSLPIYYL
ncbi:hypothetical protein [Deinococcus apachensis]|uniref:hypothetical protein n=1 Tax=Deinococcus apachensis TaxID=309886 RepID=UPI0012FCE098|nr:hypothetical protein [Deinococcus apachensis]